MKIIGGTMSIDETYEYVKYIRDKHPGCELVEIEIVGDDVILRYESIPFERIRRITGYLVGTTARWNSAKHAELEERKAHAKVDK